ncbi:MAG: acyltransferase domain-containing protein, partial [Myxococcales bacterium]|nr:acyltransferase domain-containing protein [Myxococcales bacterium]
TRLGPWPEHGALAGVSSFGFGGTNAHVVLERVRPRADAAGSEPVSDAPVLLPLSGHRPEVCTQLASALLDRLRATEGSPAAVAAALALRRSHQRHRASVVARDREQALRGLERLVQGQADPSIAAGHGSREGRLPLVLVCSGQGSQWCGMARGLLEGWPAFRASIERIDRCLSEHVPWSVVDELRADPSASRLFRTEVAQPVVFAVQVALAELLAGLGVVPDAVVGHSVGEIAAAHLAGVLSLADAARLVAHRGRVMQATAGLGRMALVGLPADEVAERIATHGGALEIAAFNGPAETVVSGDEAAIVALAASLTPQGVHCRVLEHTHPFHGAPMDPCQEQLRRAVEGIEARAGAGPRLVSTVTGDALPPERFDAAYWGRQLRAPVRFMQAIEHLAAAGHRCFVELGPHPTLRQAIEATLAPRGGGYVVASTLVRGDDGRAALLRTVGSLYVAGYDVEWSGMWPDGAVHVELPRSPLRRREHWIESAPSRARGGHERGAVHPLLGEGL